MDLTKALDAPTAIVGAVGSGKTFLGKVLVEKLLHEQRRVIIIDPTGVWWGLRAGADGKAGGFPVTIFGGDHADIAIDTAQGALVAEALATREVQAIIDISDMSGGEKVRFLTAFLSKLYQLNRAALHLVVDEADEVAPQNPMPDEKQLSGIFDKIVRRGRVRGFRPLMITQRPAVLHKNVLSQIGTLIAMKLTSPQDRNAIDAWVKGNADAEQAKAVMTSLASLQRGEGWVWSPAAGILDRRKFPPIITFDSSRTPEIDEVVVEPAMTAVDVAQLRDAMSVVEPPAETKRPTAPSAKALEEAEKRGYERGLEEGKMHGFKAGFVEGIIASRNAINDIAIDAVGTAAMKKAEPIKIVSFEPAASSVIARPAVKKAQATANGQAAVTATALASGFNGPQTKVLRAMAMWKALGAARVSRPQVAMIAGYSHGSGNFGNILGQLKAAGAIDYPEPGMLELLTDVAAMTPEEAKASFLDKFTAPQRKLVDALAPAGELSRQQLAEATGYSAGSGNFGNLIGQLRTLGVVDYPRQGAVAMAPWVFHVL